MKASRTWLATLKDELPDIESQLPSGLDVRLAYDASDFIEDSINEVIQTLLEAMIIVLVVVFLCLGSIRASIVPSVAVPLSLVGGAFIMLMFGFSLNLLTLLSMVLAIGLVVDDAIVVLENIHRRMEEYGETPLVAAYRGTRQVLLCCRARLLRHCHGMKPAFRAKPVLFHQL